MAQVGESSLSKSKQDKKARRAAKIQQKGETSGVQSDSRQVQTQNLVPLANTGGQQTAEPPKEKKQLTKAERRAIQVVIVMPNS